MKIEPLISICVPTFNGLPHISNLIDQLLVSSRKDFEIVISDDCSTDGTWDYVKQKSSNDARLKCYRNTDNMGMDANFARSVSLANGKYVWLTGQDDLIECEGIDVLSNLVISDPEIEFVYLNHKKLREGDKVEEKKSETSLKNTQHTRGKGLKDFLLSHDFELPTFLPKFVMKKEVWDSVDLKTYMGTCYCQVGVFLEVAENIKWCHMNGNYVLGLTPKNGWQSDAEKFSRISYGLFLMLSKAQHKCPWIDSETKLNLIKKYFKRLFFSSLMINLEKVKISNSYLSAVLDFLKYSPLRRSIILSVLNSPRSLVHGTLILVRVRRAFRRISMGKNHEGPNIE